MIRRQLFLIIRHHHRPAFGTHHHLVFGVFKVIHRDKPAANAGSGQRSLVHQIGQIGTRKAGAAARDDAQIYIRAKRGFARMH